MKHRNKYISINGLVRFFLLIHLFCFSGIVGQYSDLVNSTDNISLVQSHDGVKAIPIVSFNKAKIIHQHSSIKIDTKSIIEDGLVHCSNLNNTFFNLRIHRFYGYKQIIKEKSEGVYLPNSLEFLIFV